MQYTSNINWSRGDVPFTVKTYDRTHTITLGGGSSLQGSSAPEFLGKAELANPEELFTSSISSCFMLSFLHLAAMKNLSVESYTAEAIGTLAKNAEGKMAMTEVLLKPTIVFADPQPDDATVNSLLEKAHGACFISSSVKTDVKVERA